MGKQTSGRSKTQGLSTTSMKAYFPRTAKDNSRASSTRLTEKMAAAEASDTEDESSQLAPEVLALLDNLEDRFASRMENLLKPMSEQIQDLTEHVQAISQTAEMALEQGITLQNEVQDLQASETWARSKIMELENAARFHNLKFRGFPESCEGATDLPIFLATWLASILNLEEGIAPLIDRAYRLGARKRSNPAFTRDIVASFPDYRTRNKILKEATNSDSFVYNDKKILIFQDLSPETLQRRRDMKAITKCLQDAKIMYRWSPPSRLTVRKGETTLFATDPFTGTALLQKLDIEIPAELRSNPDASDVYLVNQKRWKKVVPKK